MPLYATLCEGCSAAREIRLSFSDYDGVKLGVRLLECTTCQGKVNLAFDPGNVSFVLKDGESGGWASKANKENAYRAKRYKRMGQVQRDHAPTTKLQPNFGGELMPTWKDARDAAFDVALTETKDVVAAKEASATYDPLVKQEGS